MHSAQILVIEDSPSLGLTYKDFLEREKHRVIVASTAAEARRLLGQGRFGALLLDLNLPDENGIDFLKWMRANNISVPVIVITADPSVDIAVMAIREGAQDFISKPVTPERLNLTLRNIIEQQSLKSIVDGMRDVGREGFCGFVGKSPAMQVIYRIIENAAQSRAPIFITGESGTGKELAARAVHGLSQRKAGPFEALNCAAIPGALLESEVFGHARGAFTGAVSAHKGAAERAHGGTLFLDELGEMPVEMQSKMLRFTQSSSLRPVGGSHEVSVDVRFISATNRDPLHAVREGKMREDLYYRLNVIPLHLPPLRERGDDVLHIARSILKKTVQEEGKKFQGISPGAESFFLSCPWPGNIRQLQNTIRRAVVMHDGEALTRDMLPPTEDLGHSLPEAVKEEPIMPLHMVERRVIEQAILFCHGNISEAARKLELNPSTLHRKINQWRDGS